MEKEKEISYRYGTRAPLRDRILELMSDGKTRKSKEIADAIQWPTTTSITKTLTELKMKLRLEKDRRVLVCVKPDNCRKGIDWTLIR